MTVVNLRASPPVVFMAFARDDIPPYAGLPRLEEEARQVRNEMATAERAGRCVLVVLQYATLDGILAIFDDERYREHIAAFHFAGHGEEGAVVLHGDSGQARYTGMEGLANFLLAQQGLRFIFLNACWTQGISTKLLSTGSRAAVTIKGEIGDEWAMRFAVHFYRALGGGAAVGEAYTKARGAVEAEAYHAAYPPDPEQWVCTHNDPDALAWSLPPPARTELSSPDSFLAGLNAMLAQRGFSPDEQAVLLQVSQDADNAQDGPGWSTDYEDGDFSMTMDSASTIPLGPHLLRRAARKLFAHMSAVARSRDIWPDLLIGDDLVDTSIRSLSTIQLEVKNAARFVESDLPAEYQWRHRREREGLLKSADSLANLFTQLSASLDTDPERRRTLAEMQRQLNELSYYTSRYIIWLEMAANIRAGSQPNLH